MQGIFDRPVELNSQMQIESESFFRGSLTRSNIPDIDSLEKPIL